MFHKGWWLVHYFFTEIYVIFFIDTSSDIANYGWYCEKLTHFQPVFRFYTPWKHEKTGGFLMFSSGIKINIGWKWVNQHIFQTSASVGVSRTQSNIMMVLFAEIVIHF